MELATDPIHEFPRKY